MAQLCAWGKSQQTQRFAAFRDSLALAVTVVALALTLLSPRIAHAKYAAIVVDAGTGVVRHEAHADDRNSPASLTKLMTLYLLFEAIENKRLSWSTPLSVSRHAANQPPTHLALSPGDKITAKEAALAVIIHSANDVAVVIAEALGDTEEKFALKMTSKARKIGMTRTTFRNASGLPHAGQFSTARDMAILAQALMDRFPQYYPMFSESSLVWKGRVYRSHNRVTLNYAGADGLKTGYTHASGFNLVTSAVHDGRRLIGVVFGGNTAAARDQQMTRLLDAAFAKGGGTLVAHNTKARVQKAAVVRSETAKSKTKAKKKAVVAEGDDDGDDTVASVSSSNDRADWGIQVGAFATKTPAETTARSVSRKYAKVLKGGHVNVAPLASKKGRTLYRARIMGIDRDAAHEACKMLKRAKQACMELRGSDEQEVAERASTSIRR